MGPMAFSTSTSERLAHTVAFRLTPTGYLDILPFFEAFGSDSEALRWLLDQPEVQRVIKTRVDEWVQQS